MLIFPIAWTWLVLEQTDSIAQPGVIHALSQDFIHRCFDSLKA